MDPVEHGLLQLASVLARVESTWRREHSLTANEGLVVLTMTGGTIVSPSELSRLVGVTTAGMTTLLDRLESSGWLTRGRHPTDGRRIVLMPTKQALRARMSYESVLRAMTAPGGRCDDVVVAFLEGAVRAGGEYAGDAVDPRTTRTGADERTQTTRENT